MKLADLAVKHEYYCSTSNYHSRDCNFKYETLQDFLDDMSDSDMDMNLLFRWDVSEKNSTDVESDKNPPKEYYAEMFFIHQRKGNFVCYEIDTITEEDVDAFVYFVKPRYAHIMKLWAPFGK